MTGVSKLEMHPPIELHRGRTPNNGQFLTTSYMSLYIILDTYLYSKAVVTGHVCLSKIILPLVYSDIDTTPATNLQS